MTQLEDAYLSIHGMRKDEEQDTKKPQECVCGSINTSKSRYCFRCGNPLNVSVAVQDQEIVNTEIGKTMQVFAEIMQNPEMFEKFKEFKRKNVKKE